MTRRCPQHLIDARNAASLARARHDLSASPIAPTTPSHASPVALPPSSFPRLPRRRPVITLLSLYAERKAAGTSHLAHAIFRCHRRIFDDRQRSVPAWGHRFLRLRQQLRREAVAYRGLTRGDIKWLPHNSVKDYTPPLSDAGSEDGSDTQGESGYHSEIGDADLYCPEPDSVESIPESEDVAEDVVIPSSQPEADRAYELRQLYPVIYDSDGNEIIVLDSDVEE